MALYVSCKNSKNPEEAPENIREVFIKMHPKATILNWVDESPIWEAKYKDGQEQGAVSFDQDGMVTETELVIEKNQLPNFQIIDEYIHSQYPNEKPQQYEKVTKENGTISYEIQITGKELVFDSRGEFTSVEPD